MDLFDKMGDIPGLDEFLSAPVPMGSRVPMDDEPVSLDTVPTAQRIQAMLAERYDAAWYSAFVLSYPLPDGACSHVAMTQYQRGLAMKMVHESPDGKLTLLSAFPPISGDMQTDGAIAITSAEQASAVAHEQHCLSKILPALIEASQVVQDAEISKRRKKRILHELAHASQHLADNFEAMQNGY